MPWNSKQQGQGQNEQIGKLIRQKLLSTPSIIKLFEQFEVDPERLEKLVIQIVPLDQKYAETDEQSMKINSTLFQEGLEVFMKKYFFIIAHEIVHWLSRVKEQESYFHDPEEVLGFVSSIAYEISEGTHPDEIWNKVYNKVSWHFHNESDAREFFSNMIEKAKQLVAG